MATYLSEKLCQVQHPSFAHCSPSAQGHLGSPTASWTSSKMSICPQQLSCFLHFWDFTHIGTIFLFSPGKKYFHLWTETSHALNVCLSVFSWKVGQCQAKYHLCFHSVVPFYRLKLGCGAQACSPNCQKAEKAGGLPWVWVQLRLHGGFQLSMSHSETLLQEKNHIILSQTGNTTSLCSSQAA